MTDRKKEYSELLKDPRWQRLRLQVFERDEWACRFCGDKKATLAVHHTEYVRGNLPWEYDPHTLLTVCEQCHQIEYERRRQDEQSLLNLLRVEGVSSPELHDFTCSLAQLTDMDMTLALAALSQFLRTRRKDFDSWVLQCCKLLSEDVDDSRIGIVTRRFIETHKE